MHIAHVTRVDTIFPLLNIEFLMILQDKNGSLVKLQKLPDGSPPGLGTSHLETVNKLREFMHKGQSAILFDDKVKCFYGS